MKKLNAGLWGRLCDLDIEYEGGAPTPEMLRAVKGIVSLWRNVDLAASEVAAYCKAQFAEAAELTDDEVIALVEPLRLEASVPAPDRMIDVICRFQPAGAEFALKFVNEQLAEIAAL